MKVIIFENSLTPHTITMASPRKRRRQVCLFGLSADPPTGESGHVGIVKTLSEMDEFDQVRVLPVYRHTFSVSGARVIVCVNKYIHRADTSLLFDRKSAIDLLPMKSACKCVYWPFPMCPKS